MKMNKMKWVDKWVGLLLCTLLAPLSYLLPRKKITFPPKKILIIKFWGMGSTIMAGYLLRALKREYPKAEITYLTLESNREIASLIGFADRIETLDLSKGAINILVNIINMLLSVFSKGYDIVLDLEYLTRFTALVTLASRAPVRSGFYARGFWRGNFHNRKTPFNPYWHTRDNFLNLAKSAGIAVKSEAFYRIIPPESARIKVNKLLQEFGISAQYIIINPNAGATSLERRWHPEKFASLIDKITRGLTIPCILIGAKDEYDICSTIAQKTKNNKLINLAGMTDIPMLSALLEKAKVVVSNDSGPLHLATHVGAKVIGLYGPETPVLWGPITKNKDDAIVFFLNLDCSPCINIHNMKTVNCLKNRAECLEGISVEDVFNAVKKLCGETF